LFADNMRRGLRQWGHALAALAHPVAVGRGAAHGWREVRKLLATDPVAATSLNRVIGPDRTFALVRGRLDEAKNIAHAHDATVNDVLLTVIAGGLRALLLARGESVDDAVVRIDVPLTLRPQQAREQARGNFISQLFVPVPLGIADPVFAAQAHFRGHRRAQGRTPCVRGCRAEQQAGAPTCPQGLATPPGQRHDRRPARAAYCAVFRRRAGAGGVSRATAHGQRVARRRRAVVRRPVQPQRSSATATRTPTWMCSRAVCAPSGPALTG
jgi:hypothetical protein